MSEQTDEAHLAEIAERLLKARRPQGDLVWDLTLPEAALFAAAPADIAWLLARCQHWMRRAKAMHRQAAKWREAWYGADTRVSDAYKRRDSAESALVDARRQVAEAQVALAAMREALQVYAQYEAIGAAARAALSSDAGKAHAERDAAS